MRSEEIQEIRRMRAEGYSVAVTAQMTRTTPEQVRLAMRTQSYGNTEFDGTELIDGEPIADRIVRLKEEIRKGHLVIKQGKK
jgi:hypothetical protein